MKTERNILVAFILNILFSAFELVGGVYTGSIALISDAVHDFGDGISIGVSWFLERKSRKPADEQFTYGYGRYSVVGGTMVSLLLLLGSLLVIYNAVGRILEPKQINYNGMIPLAVIGVVVNLIAAYFTHGGHSLNEKAINLHMLEDVFGWVIVLIGAIVMRFTEFVLLDPILSVGVSLAVLVAAWKNLKKALDIFLQKAPEDLDMKKIKASLLEIEGISDIQSLHIWSLDGQHHVGTMRITANFQEKAQKVSIREKLSAYGIEHVTIETVI